MIRFVLIAIFAAVPLLLAAAGVHAKPHDIRIQLKLETVAAVHAPTGCLCSVEYNDGAYVRAFVTDPLCLPEGVAKRYIPANEPDFVAAPRSVSVTDQ